MPSKRGITYKKRNRKNATRMRKHAKSYKKRPRTMGSITNAKKSHIVKIFIEMLQTVKLYHWKTRSFAQHKATDQLYEDLNKKIDEFVEVLLGKDQSRVKMVEKRIDLLDANSTREIKERIFEYREFLTDMNIYFDSSRDSDLLSIRDEILANLNQFLYLLTFDK
jgi:DNA-binding ferritin-like protein